MWIKTKETRTGDSEKRDIMNLYVGNMPYSMTEAELKETFSAHGAVASARLVMDRETGRAKGFAFVEMPDENEAKAAIAAINGTKLGGRELVVNEARPREERPRTGGGGGFGGGNRRSSGGGFGGGNGGGGRRF